MQDFLLLQLEVRVGAHAGLILFIYFSKRSHWNVKTNTRLVVIFVKGYFVYVKFKQKQRKVLNKQPSCLKDNNLKFYYVHYIL